MKAILRSGILALAIMLVLAVPADADPFDDGVTANLDGDYATALRIFRPLAEQGHAEAQHWLGNMYDGGLGVPQDPAEAVKWWRKAAEQGYALAQSNLGVSYNTGWGVSPDYVSSYMWFSLAAAHGFSGLLSVRDQMAEKMKPDQISKAKSLADNWLAKHPLVKKDKRQKTAKQVATSPYLKGGYAACLSEELFDQFVEATVRNDWRGFEYLMKHGCMFPRAGIEVSILDTTWSGTVKVRAYVSDTAVVLWTYIENIQE